MSRKQAPPKPEELIAKLDEKFETFREEVSGVIAEKSGEIEQINAKDLEIKQTIEDNRKKGNENYRCELLFMLFQPSGLQHCLS